MQRLTNPGQWLEKRVPPAGIKEKFPRRRPSAPYEPCPRERVGGPNPQCLRRLAGIATRWGRGGMAEIPTDFFERHAVVDKQGGGGVANAVRPEIGQAPAA